MKQKTLTKLCGIRSFEELEMAARFGADAVGFLTEVPVKSPRSLEAKTAAALIEELPKGLSSVLVIMPKNASHALKLIDKVGPDVVQIHSELSLPELKSIKKKSSLPLIKALCVPASPKKEAGAVNPFSQAASQPFKLFEKLRELENSETVDAILLDSEKGTGSKKLQGGTGLVHDWALSQKLVEATFLPVILAGGLKPENVQKAIEKVSPYAVDTASGVETRGQKTARKIKKFIEAVRAADAFL